MLIVCPYMLVEESCHVDRPCGSSMAWAASMASSMDVTAGIPQRVPISAAQHQDSLELCMHSERLFYVTINCLRSAVRAAWLLQMDMSDRVLYVCLTREACKP